MRTYILKWFEWGGDKWRNWSGRRVSIRKAGLTSALSELKNAETRFAQSGGPSLRNVTLIIIIRPIEKYTRNTPSVNAGDERGKHGPLDADAGTH